MLCFFFAYAQKNGVPGEHVFYVVRHAEKDTGNDPVLSRAGQQRAGDLYRLLKDKNISRIYATKYRRSQMTGDSLKIYLHVPQEIYQADTTGNGLAEKMLSVNENGKNILIIGYSKTVMPILQKLGVKQLTLKEIAEDEFDDLYIIIKNKNKTILRKEKYGTVSAHL